MARDFNIPLAPVSDKQLLSSFVEREGYEAFVEHDAGFLLPEKAIRLLLEEAGKKGAALHTGEKIISWTKQGEGIEVITTKATYHSKRLIITAGPWANELILGHCQYH